MYLVNLQVVCLMLEEKTLRLPYAILLMNNISHYEMIVDMTTVFRSDAVKHQVRPSVCYPTIRLCVVQHYFQYIFCNHLTYDMGLAI